MTRRRKILTISLITAGIVVVAGSAATATALIHNNPAEPQPAAFDPTHTPSPRPAPTLPDYGRQACQELFASDVLDLGAITDALEREDHNAVDQWVEDLYGAARQAVTAEQQPVRDAAADVRTIIEDGRLGDLFAMPEPPVLAFALACTEADLVEQHLIDRWADSLSG